MGGHPNGNVASRIATEAAAAVLREELTAAMPEDPDRATRLGVAMSRSMAGAHRAIRAEGERDPDLVGMGTTLTGLLVDRGTYVLGHVGDSRAYRFRSGTITQLTRDDTWVQERIDANLITPEQARRHPYSHLLTQCLGLDDMPTPSILQGQVEAGDVYLLCTDGLVGMLDDAQVEEILERELPKGAGPRAIDSAVRALIDSANEAGGHDNITAVLVAIGPR
jgi:serine/threonine protein phosphatase PrpC